MKTRWVRVLNPDAKAAPEIVKEENEEEFAQASLFDYMSEEEQR